MSCDMTKEVMQQALEALKNTTPLGFNMETDKKFYSAIEALEEALNQKQDEPVAYINVEQRKLEWAKYTSWETPTVVNLPKIPLYTKPQSKQEQGEPVGKFAKFTDGIWREVTDGSAGVPLYTHPKEWVGLTDEDNIDWEEGGTLRDLVKAIEAKLKEKNA